MRIHGLNTLSVMALLVVALACAGPQNADSGAADEPAFEASHAADQVSAEIIQGEVVETMDSGGYTYFLMDTGEKQVWAAASQLDLQTGERVTIPVEMAMEQFHSDTLDRTFDRIYFVSVVGREGRDPLGANDQTLGLPPGHPTLDGVEAIAPNEATAGLESVDGATPIAEIWERRAQIAGSKVTISGLVVKYNANILGKNWLHLQDDSGDAEAGTNDLTVTSVETAAVGDTLTATGILAVDRDFGAGYTYQVILENATLTLTEQ
ncbi:MAG: hypothetical protein PVG92_02680 [Holophagae bacterium]|jgi:hypothetical protein